MYILQSFALKMLLIRFWSWISPFNIIPLSLTLLLSFTCRLLLLVFGCKDCSGLLLRWPLRLGRRIGAIVEWL